MDWLDKFVNYVEKAGLVISMAASGCLCYAREYGAAIVFALYGITLILLMIIDNDDGDDFYA